jgi:hypothetical protein
MGFMRSKTKYLFNRGGTFYLIMKIPADLKAKFNATWLKRSLKCTDIGHAKIVSEGMLGKIALSFALLRSGMLSPCPYDNSRTSFIV